MTGQGSGGWERRSEKGGCGFTRQFSEGRERISAYGGNGTVLQVNFPKGRSGFLLMEGRGGLTRKSCYGWVVMDGRGVSEWAIRVNYSG